MISSYSASIAYNLLLIAHVLLRCFFKKEKKIIQLALFERESLTLSLNYTKDRLVGLKETIRIFKRSNSHPTRHFSSPSNNILIVCGENTVHKIIEYIHSQSDKKISTSIEKNDIRFNDINSNFLDKAVFLLFCGIISFLCVFLKKRIHISLLIRSVVEFTYVDQFIKKNKHITQLNFFNPYVNDVPFWCYYLKKKHSVYTRLIPSITPISLLNFYSYADEMILSSEYQYEEILNSTTLNNHIQKYTFWKPEGCYALSSSSLKNEPNTIIGFYSHGQWLRNKNLIGFDRGHIQNIEESILKMLNLYCSATNLKINIFLHPLEMGSSETMKEAQSYYEQFISKDAFSFVLSNRSNIAESFDTKIGVGAFSSVLLERLSLGMPILIASDKSWSFPISGTKLENISFNPFDDSLLNRIFQIQNQTQSEFFESFNLKHYIKQ
jgi:hypothetical protein